MSPEHTASGGIKVGDEGTLTECGETLAVVRKKALLRVLACRDAERAGIRITDADIAATSEDFRRGFGLEKEEDFVAWMTIRNLSAGAFAKAMRDFAVVRALELVYAREIDNLVHNQIAVSTARLRSGG